MSHKLFASFGSAEHPLCKGNPVPMFPACNLGVIRTPEKLADAKGIHGIPCPVPPKSAVILTGWKGSSPKVEKLYVWNTPAGIVFATPHNQKAGRVDAKATAFLGSEIRSKLGITLKAEKAPKAKEKAKKGKPGAKHAVKAKPVSTPSKKAKK